MAAPTILQEERSYRRGLVLGFTLAEIVVLVIFLLLLALATLLARKEQELLELAQELERAETRAAANAHALAELERVVDAVGGRDAFDDDFKVLVESLQAIDSLKAERRALEERIAKLLETEQMLAKEASGSEGALEEFIADGAAGRALREAQAATSLAGVPPPELIALALKADASAREVANLKGQVQNLRNRLSTGGRGTEYPPCWAETGRIEYIFDVALSAEGFVVRERDLPHRVNDHKELPLERITTGRLIDATTFLAQFDPLFTWSVQHECRFFVRAFDQTGPTEKEIFKRQMRVLEARFYKYEVLDASF
ncbi:MAG: hypothetical protein ACREJ5_08125 [Geminicoccaceae bacterium]